MTDAMRIRPFEPADWVSVWPMLHATFLAGDVCAYPPEGSEAEVFAAWVTAPAATFVAETTAEKVVGVYYIKPNQPGLGSHVANCGYVVAPEAQRQGIAAAMCEHSQRQAVAMGFRAMQFNLVVATNAGAVRLWQRLGFTIVGTLPGAFHHRRLGYVDAHVMFKPLVEG